MSDTNPAAHIYTVGCALSFCVRLCISLGSLVLPCLVVVCTLVGQTPSSVVHHRRGISAQHSSHVYTNTASVKQLIIRKWSYEQGLPDNQLSCALQARDGYLWLGAQNGGVIRFDGLHFTRFAPANAPTVLSSPVAALHQDRLGVIWIGTINGLLSYNKGQWQTLTTAQGLPHNRIQKIVEDREGNIWVGTFGGLARISRAKGRETITTFTVQQNCGLKSNNIRSIAQDSLGRIWVGAYSCGEIYRLERGQSQREHFVCFDTDSVAGVRAVLAIAVHPNGTLWFATDKGLLSLHNGVMSLVYSTAELRCVLVKRLAIDTATGDLWIGTIGGGLYRRRGAELERLTTEDGLSDNGIEHLEFDRESSLWVVTDYGINQVREGIVKPLLWNGLPLTLPTNCVLRDSRGGLWIGTNQGLYGLDNGVGRVWTLKDGLGSNLITSLFEDSRKRLWIGTNTGGVHVLEHGRLRRFTTNDGLCGNVVRGIQEGDDGSLWLGTDGGVSRVIEINGAMTITSFTAQHGLSPGSVTSIAFEPGKGLWVGYFVAKAIERISNDGTIHRGFPLRDSAMSLLAVQVDADQRLWVFTNLGFAKRVSDTLQWFQTVPQTLPKSTQEHREQSSLSTVYAVRRDNDGTIWFGGKSGMTRLLPKTFESGFLRHRTFETFGLADGMRSQECAFYSQPIIAATSDGTLLVATERGVAMIETAKIRLNTQKPLVSIEALRADTALVFDATLPQRGDGITLPHHTEKLEFDYTALCLQASEAAKFQYMLEGYDNAWTEPLGRRTAYYTNLPYGRTYRFRVRACNNHGVWSDGAAELLFRIAEPWWASWWAYCFYGTSVLTVVVAALRVRDKQQRKRLLLRQREREAEIVRKKNEELARANAELERLNNEKNEIMGIVAHDLKNPLSTIMLSAELLERTSSKQESVIEYASGIYKSAERMLELIKNLLEMNALERGGVQINLAVLDVGLLMQTIVEFYLPSAEQKEIHLHYPTQEGVLAIADEQALMQVLDNLVSNAVKYSPHGKNVYVRVKPCADAVRVEVQDEGEGISPEDMTKLFAKFARLSARPTGGEHSTGLGLSIVKKLVEAMNGRVWCESELGKGATFIVELPTTPEPP